VLTHAESKQRCAVLHLDGRRFEGVAHLVETRYVRQEGGRGRAFTFWYGVLDVGERLAAGCQPFPGVRIDFEDGRWGLALLVAVMPDDGPGGFDLVSFQGTGWLADPGAAARPETPR
jgi:hypothetical protein